LAQVVLVAQVAEQHLGLLVPVVRHHLLEVFLLRLLVAGVRLTI
jgi:hypothetical protein